MKNYTTHDLKLDHVFPQHSDSFLKALRYTWSHIMPSWTFLQNLTAEQLVHNILWFAKSPSSFFGQGFMHSR